MGGGIAGLCTYNPHAQVPVEVKYIYSFYVKIPLKRVGVPVFSKHIRDALRVPMDGENTGTPTLRKTLSD